MSDRNLIITGMMGSGKSTVAPLVAQKLGRRVVDTDEAIEKRLGKKIAAIFADDGEATFRKAEAELCAELAEQKGLVIATGGGFLVPLASQQVMERHAVFCLDASLQTIAGRIENNAARPLASKIKTLLAERQSAYQRIFHHIDTNNQNADRAATEIVERFKLDDAFASDQTRMVRMPHQVPYPIVVKEGALLELPLRLKWLGILAPRIIVITNGKLKGLVEEALTQSCAGQGFVVEWLVMPEGEKYKTLETVSRLYQNLLLLGTKRDDVIVALGGGVVGDVAGFVAATYMRGLKLVQVPTTLLAMVDSSIGGKTGVDAPEGKNLIGAFKQPLMVLADPAALDTLPEDEFSSGMAEVIKHAMISDRDLFEALLSGAKMSNQELVFRALCVKADIVEEDPFEHDRRALLNLGHTFGHAFEKVSNYTMRHGEAVAIGMVAACELGHRLALCAASLRPRVESVLTRFGLLTRLQGMRIDDVMKAFQHDKKNTFAGLRFVVPHDVGDVRLQVVQDDKMLRDVLNSVVQ